MTYIRLQQYFVDCWLYGWKPNFKGLKAYDAQIKSGVRYR